MGTPGILADNPTEVPKRRRRLRVRLALGCVTVLLVGVTVFALIVVPNWIDGPPVDDADLVPPRLEIAPEDDAGPLLAAFFQDEDIFAGLAECSDDRFAEDYEALMECDAFGEGLSEERWRASALRAWIVETEVRMVPAFARLEAIVQRPHAWLPPAESYDDESVLSIVNCRLLTEYTLLTAHMHYLEGDHDRGPRRLLILWRTSQHSLRAPQTVIALLVSRAVTAAVLQAIDRLIANDGLREWERALIEELESWALTPATDTYALLREYQLQRRTVLGFLESDFTEDQSGLGKLLFRPNDTILQLAEYHRSAIAEGERTGRVTINVERFFDLDPSQSWWSRFVEGNVAGRALIGLTLTDLDRVYTKGRDSRARVECTRTLLGLSVYQRKHGRLPDSLAELVPTVLSTIPIDPWDGQPLRYGRERRFLWSVGVDGIDGGAVDRPEDEWGEAFDTADPYVEIPEW